MISRQQVAFNAFRESNQKAIKLTEIVQELNFHFSEKRNPLHLLFQMILLLTSSISHLNTHVTCRNY